MVKIKIFLLMMIVSSLHADVWNNPHSKEKSASNTLFTSFSLSPKRLDPVVSYSSNEWAFIGQIYEPPLQYNYIQKPYRLEPLTLIKMPTIRYLNKERQEVDENDKKDWEEFLGFSGGDFSESVLELLSKFPDEIVWFNAVLKKKKEAFEMLRDNEREGHAMLAKIFHEEKIKFEKLLT